MPQIIVSATNFLLTVNQLILMYDTVLELLELGVEDPLINKTRQRYTARN